MSTLAPAAPIARTELRLIVRNKTVLFSASLFPLVFGVYFVTMREDTRNAGIAILGLLVMFFSLFSIYTTITTTLVSRREDLYLKRLRSGEASDAAIVLGLVAPVVLLCLAQLVVVLGFAFGVGVQLPGQWFGVLAATVGMMAVSVGVGVLTAVLTPSASASQITSLPFFMAALGSFIGAGVAEHRLWDLTPGGAVVTLLRWSYDTPTPGTPWVAAASLVLWTWVALDLARRRFRWEPRA